MRGAGWFLKYSCCELARERKGTTYHREPEPAQGALGEGSAPKRRAARGTLRRWPRILRRSQNLDLLPPLNQTPRKENRGPVHCLGMSWRGCVRGLDVAVVVHIRSLHLERAAEQQEEGAEPDLVPSPRVDGGWLERPLHVALSRLTSRCVMRGVEAPSEL